MTATLQKQLAKAKAELKRARATLAAADKSTTEPPSGSGAASVSEAATLGESPRAPDPLPPPTPMADGATQPDLGTLGLDSEQLAAVESKELSPRALVALCDVVLFLTVRVSCASGKLPFDDETAKLARLTTAEKHDLEGFAPFAIPALQKWLVHSDLIGGIAFGVIFASTASLHLAAVKAHHRQAGKDDGPWPKRQPQHPGMMPPSGRT